MSTQIVRGLSESQYHADDTHLSASAAKVLLGKRPPGFTAALEFGTFFHVVVLEPDRLDEYVPLDAERIGLKSDGTPATAPTMTGAWKKAVAEVEQDGKRVVAQADWDRAHAMADAVKRHPVAAELLGMATDYELSLFGTEPATGAPVRGRLDITGRGYVADLKSASDADPERFGRRAYDLGYHISAANYLDLAEQLELDAGEFAFVNVESEPTLGGEHRVSVTQLAPAAVEQGRADMAEACRRWLALGKRVDLPAFGSGYHVCDLPPWAYRDPETDYQELSA